MIVLGAVGSFVVSPNLALFLYTVIVLVVVVSAVVCAFKGRWGFLALGVFTFGIFVVAGALRPSLPGSVWSRLADKRVQHG